MNALFPRDTPAAKQIESWTPSESARSGRFDRGHLQHGSRTLFCRARAPAAPCRRRNGPAMHDRSRACQFFSPEFAAIFFPCCRRL